MFEQYWENLKLWLWNAVWAVDVNSLSPVHAFAVRSVRVGHTLVQEFLNGELNQRAASLVFTTLLSLVPLLAVSFAVLKAFGVHHDLEQSLIGLLTPLGDKGIELGERIMNFVDNVNGRVLGGIGLSLLLLTVLSLIHKVERAFNYIWRVQRSRGFIERFSGYMSAVMLGPVLIFGALGLTASVMSTSLVQSAIAIDVLGTVVKWIASIVPYVLVIAAFTLIYVFIPNTRVQIRAAVLGAVVAGALWQTAGWAFASFVVSSPRHAAVYSSFAIAFLFMIWLYVAWLILLVGATVAFFYQHPEYHGLPDRMITVSNRMLERMALVAVFRIAQHHYHGLPPVSVTRLAVHLGVPLSALQEVLHEFVKRKILIEVTGRELAYVPARDVSGVTLDEIWQAIRSANETRWLSLNRMDANVAVDDLIDAIDDTVSGVLGSQTLRDLVAEHPPEGDALARQPDELEEFEEQEPAPQAEETAEAAPPQDETPANAPGRSDGDISESGAIPISRARRDTD